MIFYLGIGWIFSRESSLHIITIDEIKQSFLMVYSKFVGERYLIILSPLWFFVHLLKIYGKFAPNILIVTEFIKVIIK